MSTENPIHQLASNPTRDWMRHELSRLDRITDDGELGMGSLDLVQQAKELGQILKIIPDKAMLDEIGDIRWTNWMDVEPYITKVGRYEDGTYFATQYVPNFPQDLNDISKNIVAISLIRYLAISQKMTENDKFRLFMQLGINSFEERISAGLGQTEQIARFLSSSKTPPAEEMRNTLNTAFEGFKKLAIPNSIEDGVDDYQRFILFILAAHSSYSQEGDALSYHVGIDNKIANGNTNSRISDTQRLIGALVDLENTPRRPEGESIIQHVHKAFQHETDALSALLSYYPTPISGYDRTFKTQKTVLEAIEKLMARHILELEDIANSPTEVITLHQAAEKVLGKPRKRLRLW